MLNFAEFTKKVQENIIDNLSFDYDDARVELFDVTDVKGQNMPYHGLIVIKPNTTTSSVINLNFFFNEYRKNPNFEEILGGISKRVMNQWSPIINLGDISDYEKVKDHLFIKVCNAERVEDLSAPHKIIEDIAITYHILYNFNGNRERGIIMINNKMLQTYDISKKELHEDAMSVSEQNMPVVIDSLSSMICALGGVPNIPAWESPLTFVGNKIKAYGASAIFYPGIMKKLSDQIGDFYIFPSSIHEMIVVPKDADLGMDVEDYQKMVSFINANEVKHEDLLSDSVYEYTTESDIFRKVA